MSSDPRDRIVELDKRRVWHPYTAMQSYRERVDPLVVAEAHGARLVDTRGRSYIDANASWWSCALGHGHPRLIEALRRQSERLCHTSLAGVAHEGASELAEAICRVAPSGLEHVFYSDNGSTAVEVAMKLALQYWAQNGRPERKRFAALQEGFHGETLGVTALGGLEVFRRPFEGALLDVLRVAPPRSDDALDAACAALERTLAESGDSLAALVMESVVQGAAGMKFYAPDFLRAARQLCDRHDVFLVCDEVFTGYGRTGPMWACEHAGISPDMLCSAKGFSAGMLPMAATLTTRRVFEGFLGAADRAFYYGHTFCGNPLGAAVAREVLAVFEEERVLEAAKPKAERIAQSFSEMEALPGVARPRAIGMIGALDLGASADYLADAGWRVYEEARARGAYLRPLGNVVYVAPPLNIPDADLEELLAIVRSSVEVALAPR
ncbi:MAG: adenosylmethionine--8-amino-7-oxononanoate transaminase [Myxococcales bacterium]|nr:adenosylmethionine--8-amino-7-oxononanoate transaminase [Myxococcales bacterium]MDH5565284.1 adenosylmethionine--8-amino-7-oxononanoate transaminase [Myxococcales bacterium]